MTKNKTGFLKSLYPKPNVKPIELVVTNKISALFNNFIFFFSKRQ